MKSKLKRQILTNNCRMILCTLMPPEAKVAVIEDMKDWQDEFALLLPEAGHSVVGAATTVPEARSLIPKMGELGVQVVILDGNLSPEAWDGSEGRILATEIIQIYPEIKIIGFTRDERGLKGAHVDMNKADYDGNMLNELITSL